MAKSIMKNVILFLLIPASLLVSCTAGQGNTQARLMKERKILMDTLKIYETQTRAILDDKEISQNEQAAKLNDIVLRTANISQRLLQIGDSLQIAE
ncbi:MAG: hypothetical protein QM791_12210 [Ferruginibacter sp.]